MYLQEGDIGCGRGKKGNSQQGYQQAPLYQVFNGGGSMLKVDPAVKNIDNGKKGRLGGDAQGQFRIPLIGCDHRSYDARQGGAAPQKDRAENRLSKSGYIGELVGGLCHLRTDHSYYRSGKDEDRPHQCQRPCVHSKYIHIYRFATLHL